MKSSTLKDKKQILTPQLLNKIENFIQVKGKLSYYCLFLLGEKAGLRVSEAVNFDLNLKQKENLYLIQGKHHKKRAVFVEPLVISELRKIHWKPNQTNRFAYAHFLQKVKKELNIPANVELTPHTLRRCFATYQAINGMSLPVLQQVLGHASIRTTALYWKRTSDPKEKFFIDKWLVGKLPKTVENKSKEPLKIPVIKNNWEISVNIQKINFFIPKPVNFSNQKLLAVENKFLLEKMKKLEQENNEYKKTINNLQTNLEKALNDKKKLEKQIIQTQNEKNILLKMLSVDLKKQQENLSLLDNKHENNQELHQQLVSQIEISLK